MPDEVLLHFMYGADSKKDDGSSLYVENPKEPNRVLEILARDPAGTFVDYGCGNGELLVEATKLGWNAVGVELDQKVALKMEGTTGLRIFTDPNTASDFPAADVLHLARCHRTSDTPL